MFRKTLIALTAIASLSAAALVPSVASARPYGFHHGFHGYHGWGYRGLGIAVLGVAPSCWQWVRVAPGAFQKVYVCG
jgi:hypothetical protein